MISLGPQRPCPPGSIAGESFTALRPRSRGPPHERRRPPGPARLRFGLRLLPRRVLVAGAPQDSGRGTGIVVLGRNNNKKWWCIIIIGRKDDY
jgi:hypothetical protein